MAHFNQHLQTLDSILYQIRYRDPQRIRGEVADILMKPHIASLTPQSRPLARGGPPQQLLCLVGTIPIVYNGANYNIPVNIWIVDSYPYAPPVIYVTPTSVNMTITPRHRHVDLSGMVYHPYLSSWNLATCNLIGIITSMSSVFSAEPPVRSQAPGRTASPVVTSTPSPSPYQSQPPGYPPQQNNNYPPQQPSPYSSQPPSYNSQPSSYPPQSYPPQQSSYPYQQQQQQNPPPYQQHSNPPPGYPSPPEYTPPKPEDPEVVEKRNALAKVNEKLLAEVKKFHSTTSSEIDSLSREKADNAEVGASFDAQKISLQKELDQAEQEVKQLTDKLDELTKWVEENDTDVPDIDIVTDPKDTLAKQLLGLVAHDYTIQDTLFYLDKALAADKITLDAFVKTIRSLSREQFQIRATMKKVEVAQRQQLIQQQQQQQQQQQTFKQPPYPSGPLVVPSPLPSSSSSSYPGGYSLYPQRV